mmetsp:Transcript_21251/g.42688  ORF Transcript_21251/g.42688 Transcript_21251/m.42688 type:complete len:114 (+) Transcript_21251:18-359(+)
MQAARRAFRRATRGSWIPRRTLSDSKEVAHFSPAQANKPEGGTFRQRLGAFIAGVAIMGTVGYVTLRRDIYEAAEGVEANIQALHNDVTNSAQVLDAKYAALEARLAKLERKK